MTTSISHRPKTYTLHTTLFKGWRVGSHPLDDGRGISDRDGGFQLVASQDPDMHAADGKSKAPSGSRIDKTSRTWSSTRMRARAANDPKYLECYKYQPQPAWCTARHHSHPALRRYCTVSGTRSWSLSSTQVTPTQVMSLSIEL
jgi:hypothetical protein